MKIVLQGARVATLQDHNKRPPILCITNDEEYFIVNLLVGIINYPKQVESGVTESIVTDLMTGDATT